jgi:phosphatidate cytidylyltransferase
MNAPDELYEVAAGLGGVLTLATVIGTGLELRVSDLGAKKVVENLNARIRAWWVIIVLCAGAILLGEAGIIGFFAILSFGALREMITIIPSRRSDRAALFAGYFVVPIQYGLIWMGWHGLFAVFVPVYVFFVLPLIAALSGDTRHFLARTTQIQWAVMLSVYCVSYVPALLLLKTRGLQGGAVQLIVFLLIVVQSSDVLQYIFGKLMGRTKVAPDLSPSKTVEGLLAGLAGAALIGAALWRLTPFFPHEAAAIALVVSTIGFFGGLILSAIKRDRGLKDWGQTIPGHGGVLDRLDSVCFSAPIFFHLMRYFFSV